jgi:DEAD/DEAH box helicase domain-containing protein
MSMPLACFDCRNLTTFVQVSERGDARHLVMTTQSGLKALAWSESDPRDPGVYCSECSGLLDVDLGSLKLTDTRLTYLAPADFRREPMIEELRAIRPDAHWERLDLPSRPPTVADIPPALHPALVDALERTGRASLYSHQSQAIAGALAGEDVIQATSAGSGKSLGLMLPVLDALLQNPAATAIAVFPLRALANDQLVALSRLGIDAKAPSGVQATLNFGADLPPIIVGRYDGATESGDKKAIRANARLLITTPDSIHVSLLPKARTPYVDGTSWDRLLRGLRYIVLDEIHTYQGVFGSNVAQVMRRLRRAANWWGADPHFLLASATIGNPVPHAKALAALDEVTLVDEDGSPQRGRTILICNPPLAAAGRVTEPEPLPTSPPAVVGRIAPQTVAIDLISGGLVASPTHPPVRTIAFVRSRVEVASTAKRLQRRLRDAHHPDLADAIAMYVATFTTDDRMEEEGRLRDGSSLAVISTSALELGIDIPELSVAILIGYPGQISSFRQRAGRAGRAGEGLAVLIVGDDPLQQYLARDPIALRRLLDGLAEDVVINPDAPEVVRRFGLEPAHLELGGIAFEDERWFGSAVTTALERVTGPPAATHRGINYWNLGWAPPEGDANRGIRSSASAGSFTVLAITPEGHIPIGTIDAATAPRDAFVDAIWNDKSASYRVIGRRRNEREILCEGPVQVDYITRGTPRDQVTVLDAIEAPVRQGDTTIRYSGLRLERTVPAYKRIPLSGGSEQRLPVGSPWWDPVVFETEGFHLDIPLNWIPEGVDSSEAMRALEHVLLAVTPAVVACDPFDLDASSHGLTVFVYDSFGGGIGLSRSGFTRFGEVAPLGMEVVATCPCLTGCPSCVFLSRRPDGNSNVSKDGALAVLSLLAEQSPAVPVAGEKERAVVR